MAERVDLYGSAYTHHHDRVLDEIRKETFGTDIGQNSWLTVDELDRWLPWLDLGAGAHALEVASGSGGPALHVARTTGCRVTGIDANESGVATATAMATRSGQAERARFSVVDANRVLPFPADTFDALLCIDAMNHLEGRVAVLREWHRVLRPGRRALFTDPVVVTGPVTHDDLALRSAVGPFLFVPPGVNEQLVADAGLRLVHREDASDNAATVSERWQRARLARREDLVRIEGEERFEGLQRFFEAVHRLTSERRLSRFAYVAEKPGAE